MNKSQFAEYIAQQYEAGNQTSVSIVDLFLKAAARALIQEEKLELGDFGTFMVDRKTIPETKVIFEAGSMLDPVKDPGDSLTPDQLAALLEGL